MEPIHLAIVDPVDKSAVMDLLDLVPASATSTEPVLFKREDTGWVRDDDTMMSLRGATPPPVVTLDAQTFPSVLQQVDASLVFCIGPLAILGSIQDGLLGDYNLLAIKSTLDGFAGLAFASTLGIGVTFAALTVLVYQGGISLLAMLLGSAIGSVTRETPWVIEMSATGGVLILGIGLLLLDLKQVRIANLLPAVFLAPLIVTEADGSETPPMLSVAWAVMT